MGASTALDMKVYGGIYCTSHEGMTLTLEEYYLDAKEHDIWWHARYFLSCPWVVGEDGVDQREREGDWQGMRDELLRLASFLFQRPFWVQKYLDDNREKGKEWVLGFGSN
jgi:hypothetical protein